MRIAMYGGTFNPPHLGHLAAAESCIRHLQLDRLLLMPDRVPPHKHLGSGSPTAEQRFEMVKLAAQLVPGAEASDLELRREGKSYTADTMSVLRRLYPGDRLWLVVGTDMLRSFHHWVEPQRILSCCRLAAVPRMPGDEKEIVRLAEQLRRELGAEIDIVPHTPIPVSSTLLRQGRSPELIPEPVLRYIKEQNLYHD